MKSLETKISEAKKKATDAKKEVAQLEAELSKQKEAKKPKPIWELITSLAGVYKRLKCNPKKDVIKIDKFNKKEHEVLEGIVERMRIAKVYNGGKLPARKERWFPWSYLKPSGSGLDFAYSTYYFDTATLNSAARLSFIDKDRANAYGKHFMAVEEKIIQL